MRQWGSIIAGLAVAALAALAVLALPVGCTHERGAATRPVIVASIFPVQDLVQQIVGDAAEVQTLMPPGMNPHDFEVTAAGARSLADARVLVLVGVHLDDWALRAAQSTGRSDLVVVSFAGLIGEGAMRGPASQPMPNSDTDHDLAVSAGHHHDHDLFGPNPHLWNDPVRTIAFIDAATPGLVALLPDHADAIRSRSAALRERLQQVDRAYREQLGRVPHKELITFHNAFDLVAERYGLEVVEHLTPIELSPGGEVSRDAITDAIALIRKHGLRTIYAEPQFPDQALKAIQAETGVRILTLDPEGNPAVPGYDSYLHMMETNLKTLVQGQSN